MVLREETRDHFFVWINGRLVWKWYKRQGYGLLFDKFGPPLVVRD